MSEFKTFEDMKNDIPEGATHYSDETDGDFFAWFKVDGDTTYSVMPDSKNFNSWEVCVWKNMFSRAKPIPAIPKPRTRTEYEKVTESIFDLRDGFERGELYWWYESDCKDKSEFVEIRSEYDLSTYFAKGNIFKRVEKEIDWRVDVDNYFLKTKYLGIDCTIEEAITRSDYCDEFLELCRVALRANGEIEW